MEEFRIYSITDRYIEYLQNQYPNVYSNKADHRTHTRKYIGTVMEINDVYKDLEKLCKNGVIRQTLIR